jgi:plastocyanin
MMRMFRLIFVLALALSSAAAAPSNVIIRQKGRTFSMASLTVAPGEPVVFLNDDTVPHNVISTAEENGFDLGLEMPGNAVPVSFTTAGVVVVMCAIHPRMHMTITVAN